MKKELKNITDNCVGIDIIFVDHEDSLYRNDIKNEDLVDSRIDFVKGLNKKYVNNEQFTLPFLSNFDDRKHALYTFDFDEKPSAFDLVDKVLSLSIEERGKLSIYPAREKGISGIKAVIIILKTDEGKRAAFYQYIYSIAVLTSSKYILNLIPDKTRLVKLDQDILSISGNFIFMKLGDMFLVENVKALENQLNFKDVIHQRASLHAEQILEMKFSDNLDILFEKVKEDTSFARKLIKVCRNSAVIEKNIGTKELIDFIKNKETYSSVLKLNEDETLFDLNSIQRCRKFLDLLDDEFLESPLTSESYIARSKDRV